MALPPKPIVLKIFLKFVTDTNSFFLIQSKRRLVGVNAKVPINGKDDIIPF